MNSLYLIVNIATISIPFIFTFHSRLRFHKTWFAFFPAVLITAVPFLIWDSYFTSNDVWGFNTDYLTGIYLWNLPLEEVLFFICIPYACVFTYHCLDKLYLEDRTTSKEYISHFLILILILTAIFFNKRLYTFYTLSSLAIILIIAKFILKLKWLKKLYIVYAILLIPFLIVNGILTGTGIEEEVVWYNENEFMGIRINTIPLEDVFYGLELILINLMIYKSILKRKFINSDVK